ncbi:MAG: hypothetical protein ACYSVY_07325 [Planctomycetota bacterium]
MNKTRRVTFICCCAVMTVGAATACTPQQQPSEEAVLYYMATAQNEGKVRRTWPEGRQYVDQVLKANATLEQELGPIEQFRGVQSLWLPEDPRWRDEKQLADHIEHLYAQLDGHRAQREILLRKLGEAIEEVPASLKLAPREEAAFVEEIWRALGFVREAIPELERFAQAHLQLCREVQARADDVDPGKTGLTVRDPAHRATIEGYYEKLRGDLRARRESFVEYAARELDLTNARLGQIEDKRAEKHQYQYLTDHRKNVRDGLEAIPKRLLNLIQKQEEALTDLEKSLAEAASEKKSELESRIAFVKLYIRHLDAERAELKPRIDAIVKQASKRE